eukprot:scaffold14362_cov142-Isochrysis_galbana.AAC.9
MIIVPRTLVLVAQYSITGLDLLEGLSRQLHLLYVFVGVPYKRQFAVCLLERLIVHITLHTEHLIMAAHRSDDRWGAVPGPRREDGDSHRTPQHHSPHAARRCQN